MHARTIARVVLTSYLLVLPLAGCNNAADGDAKAGASGAAKGGKGAAESKGPVFKTKMMGAEMVQALVQKDLVAPLVGLEITAPEKAKVEESRGAVHLVAAGVNYSISIRQTTFDKAKSLEVFKMLDDKGTVVDESDTHLIFKRASGSHLLSAVVTVDGKPYVCGSVATAADFTREEIDQTLASCKTLKKKG